MTKPYFFPFTEAFLTSPNRSMCKSSRGLEMETTFLALKEVWHASQREYEAKFKIERPLTKLILLSLEILLMLT